MITYYRHAPRITAPGPGFFSYIIYVEQEIGHLCMVLTHAGGAIDTPIGLMGASLGEQAGPIGSPQFLNADFAEYGSLLTDCCCLWKTIWEFVLTFKIRLVYNDQVLPQLQGRE
jgi:hypothetical protein